MGSFDLRGISCESGAFTPGSGARPASWTGAPSPRRTCRERSGFAISGSSNRTKYFYDLGHELLEDRGSLSASTPPSTGPDPEDDYVWLGGRPVALVRGGI